MQAAYLVAKGMYGTFEVFGPTVEFLISPEEETIAGYCVIRGIIPAGGQVPIHSHSDVESLFTISGAVQVLSQKEDRFEWLDVKAGDFIQIPSGAKHAFRNRSSEPVVQLITTNPPLGRFFREIGKPITPGAPSAPPTPEELQNFCVLPPSTSIGWAPRKKMRQSEFPSSRTNDRLGPMKLSMG